MRVSLIAGIANNRAIGLNNKLLWHLKEDLQNFKRLTMGHHILMGRKTFNSIGRPLPGRTNLVLSRSQEKVHPDCPQMPSIDQAIEYAKSRGESELFIIGGEQIYTQCLALADRLYLSRVNIDADQADAFFPEFEKNFLWTLEHEQRFADSEPSWTFQILAKQGGKDFTLKL